MESREKAGEAGDLDTYQQQCGASTKPLKDETSDLDRFCEGLKAALDSGDAIDLTPIVSVLVIYGTSGWTTKKSWTTTDFQRFVTTPPGELLAQQLGGQKGGDVAVDLSDSIAGCIGNLPLEEVFPDLAKAIGFTSPAAEAPADAAPSAAPAPVTTKKGGKKR